VAVWALAEAQGGKGRDHHNLGFTMWMAGGGIKGEELWAQRTISDYTPSGSASSAGHSHHHP